jgi:hypothetical protein
MKTDSDYLWDKTGEPDPEIQQLEEILGTLKYQPRPLEIPAGLSVGLAVGRERSFFRSAAPGLAIAATLAMLLIGLGVWFAWQRSQRFPTRAPSDVAKSTDKAGSPANPTNGPTNGPTPNPTQTAQVAANPKHEETAAPSQEPSHRQRGPQRINRSFVAVNSNRARNEVRSARSARQAKERQEAALAKDQLLLALRLTSAKLSFAQKKTQTTNSPEPVHNQHKIG